MIQRAKWPVLLALAAILILAGGLRAWHITSTGLTVDELGSLEVAAGRGQLHLRLPRSVWIDPAPAVTRFEGAAPIWRIAPMMGSDVHPPLYFISLRVWEDLFGDSDAAIRLMSALFGVIGVALVFDIGRILGTPAIGIWAALLMAVAQPQIISSQDARPYTLALAFILAANDAVVRIDQLGLNPRRAIVLAIALAGACLTHYFVLPTIAAMSLYLLWRLRGKDRLRITLILAAVGIFVLAIWGPSLWEQRKNFADPWMYWFNDDAPNHVTATFRRFAELPLHFLADFRDPWAFISGILFLFPFLLLRRRPQFLLLGLWLVGTPAMVGALDLLRGTNQLDWIKYMIFSAPAAYLLFPLIVTDLRPILRHGLPATALLAAILALPTSYNHGEPLWTRVTKALAQHRKSGDPIILAGSTWGRWYTGALYMGIERFSPPIDGPVALLDAPATPQFASSLRGRRAWLVMSWTNQSPADLLPGAGVHLVEGFPFVAMLYELHGPPALPTSMPAATLPIEQKSRE